MGGAVFVIAADYAEHWQRALEAGFWESTRRVDVQRNDVLVFWQAGRRELLGLTVATAPSEPAEYSVQSRPWLERDRTDYRWRYRFAPIAGTGRVSIRWPDLMAAGGQKPTRGANTAPIVLSDSGSRNLLQLLHLVESDWNQSPSIAEDLVKRQLSERLSIESASMPYAVADESITSAASVVFERDPEAVDRGLRGHARTQNAAAAWLADIGAEVRSPLGGVNFDLAWSYQGREFVGEVKSLHELNERHQIRLGIGQVLEFAYRLNASPVLILEREPSSDHWQALCRRHGIALVWPGSFQDTLASG